MKLFIAGCILTVGALGYAIWYHTPIKKEQYDIGEQVVLNASCSWDEPYLVPVVQTNNGVTSMTIETRYTTYYGNQNQVVRYWTERNTYRNGEVKVTQESSVIQELTTCH